MSASETDEENVRVMKEGERQASDFRVFLHYQN